MILSKIIFRNKKCIKGEKKAKKSVIFMTPSIHCGAGRSKNLLGDGPGQGDEKIGGKVSARLLSSQDAKGIKT